MWKLAPVLLVVIGAAAIALRQVGSIGDAVTTIILALVILCGIGIGIYRALIRAGSGADDV